MTLLLLLFFSPSWVTFRAWARVPEVFSRVIPVRRGAWVAKQVADPFVAIDDPYHGIVRWRLLMPMLGHYLHLPVSVVLALSWVGCVAVLATVIRLGRARGLAWSETAMLAVVVGAAGWFFTATGWLGYYDSWLVLGFLAVAWAETRWLVWLACLLTPWIDERFVLGVPLAFVVRWIRMSPGPSASRARRSLVTDLSIAALLVAAYVALRLWLAGQAGSPSLEEYRRGIDANVPLSRHMFGSWQGLRAGWFLVGTAALVLLARRRVLAAALLAVAVGATTIVGLASANDLGRAMAPLAAVVPLGWILGRTTGWWKRSHAPPVLAAAALLLPAEHVVSTFTVPVEPLGREIRLLFDPPPSFAPDGYLEEAENTANRGDLARAETLATIGVRLGRTAGGHDVLGVVLARENRWAEALTEFDTAVELDPSLAEAWLNRARAHLATGDAAAAGRDVARVEQLVAAGSPLATQAAELRRVLAGRAP